MTAIILASASPIRAQLLRAAGVAFTTEAPQVDEDAVKESLLQADTSPREIADTLAELKARKVSARHPGDLAIGADQVLMFCGELVNKSASVEEARRLLRRLSGKKHVLISAVVLAREGAAVWRHISVVEMSMRPLNDAFIDSYLASNTDAALNSVGSYRFEEDGAQMFTSYSGDYFAVLGLPLLPLLSALREFGVLDS